MELIRLAIMKCQHQDCNGDGDSRNDGDVGDDEIGDDEDVAVMAVTEMAMVGGDADTGVKRGGDTTVDGDDSDCGHGALGLTVVVTG